MKLTEDHLVYMNIGKKYWPAAWAELSSKQRGVIAEYYSRIEEALQLGRGLYLWGPNGSGKTYIAAMMCKRVWAEYRVGSYCVTASELKACWMPRPKDTPPVPAHPGSDELRSDRVMSQRFLIVDDLVKEYRTSSGFFEDNLDTLLRHRVKEGKTTVITTNVGPKGFAEVYGQSILNLLMESAAVLHLDTPNMRVAQAQEIRSFAGGR